MRRFKRATRLEKIEEKDPAWKDWKRNQVTSLVERLAAEARALRPAIQVSTTGLMPYSRANLEAYQDWRTWLDRGLVDFVTLMCYSKDTPGFKKYVLEAKNKVGDMKRVNIAVGAYELLNDPKTFGQEFEFCEASGARACVVLHYGNLLQNTALADPLTEAHSFDKQ